MPYAVARYLMLQAENSSTYEFPIIYCRDNIFTGPRPSCLNPISVNANFYLKDKSKSYNSLTPEMFNFFYSPPDNIIGLECLVLWCY